MRMRYCFCGQQILVRVVTMQCVRQKPDWNRSKLDWRREIEWRRDMGAVLEERNSVKDVRDSSVLFSKMRKAKTCLYCEKKALEGSELWARVRVERERA